MFSLKTLKSAALITALAAGAGIFALAQNAEPETRTSYIVQGESLDAVRAAVGKLDAEVTHELGVIRAVAANLSDSEAELLRDLPGIERLYGNANVEAAGKPVKGDNGGSDSEDGGVAGDDYSHFPSLVEADRLHDQGIDGWGVTIAIVDSGIYSGPGITEDRYQMKRLKAVYDATTDQEIVEGGKGRSAIKFEEFDNDDSGHGSHVAGVASSSKLSNVGKYNGIAPAAKLVAVKVFDANGQGTYADVIRGVDWVVANKNTLGIDIINLSLSAPPRSHYWDDPLNQAVMAAWDEGIVVVAAAGNTGPDAQTIGVPGNVPYVITVGAMTDNYTPADGSDDKLATFSAAGPTYEGFVKPEVVAPGGHIMASMSDLDRIALDYPQFYMGANFFEMSGTSQATAVVSGIAALILQMEPGLTPDMVKCKMMQGARPAVDANGVLAYSVFQQGAGMVNAYNSVYTWSYDCANQGLDITADRNGTAHFGGRANQDADGNYYLMGLEGYLWTDRGISGDGFLWSNAYLWRDAYLWADAYLWTDGRLGVDGYLWSDGFLWSNAYLWRNSSISAEGFLWSAGLTEAMAINSWVDPE